MKIKTKYFIVFLLFFSAKTYGQWNDFASSASLLATTGTNPLRSLVIDNQRQLFYLITNDKIVFYDQHNPTNGWKELGGIGALYASSGNPISSDMVLDNLGNVYVGCASANGYKIWEFDITTNSWSSPFQEIERAPNPNYPYPGNDYLLYIAIDRNNNIYATGSFIDGNGNYYVQNVSQNVEVGSVGNTLSSINTANLRCSGIAITKGNTNATIIAVSLFSGSKIYSFDNSTNSWSILGNLLMLHNNFQDELVYDGNDNLYTLARLTNTTGTYNAVVRWNGTNWGEVGTPNQLNANAFSIWGLYLDGIGNVYCSAVNTGTSTHPLYQISKFTPNGSGGGTWSTIGNLNANSAVWSIAVDINCNIYTCGSFSNGSSYSFGDKYVAVWGDPSMNVLSVSNPIFNFCQNASSQPLYGVTSNCSSCQIWWKLLPNGTPSNSAPTPSTNNITPPAINYLVYQTNPNACAAGNPSATIAVNVNPLPEAPNVNSPIDVCVGSNAQEIIATDNNGNPLVNPTWIDGTNSPTSTLYTDPGQASGTSFTYTVTETLNGCTSETTELIVNYNSCFVCSNCDNTVYDNLKGVLDDKVNCINGDVNGVVHVYTGNSLTITNAELSIAPNVKIMVEDGATLTIQGSHLYGCDKMWAGIEVKPGGTLNLLGNPNNQNSCFIEDAKIAVLYNFYGSNSSNYTAPKKYFLTVDNTIFNKNYIGIEIDGYQEAITDYPFVIGNSLFTCRNLMANYSYGQIAWDNMDIITKLKPGVVAPHRFSNPMNLGSPYINDGIYEIKGVGAFLKSPYNNVDTKSIIGINLNDVGIYKGSLEIPDENNQDIDFKEISIGVVPQYLDYGRPMRNIFDNTDIGIKVINSNFKVINTTFQQPFSLFGHNAVGILAQNIDSRYPEEPKPNNLFYRAVTSNPFGRKNEEYCPNNAFYDMNTSVSINNYLIEHIENNDMQSAQWIGQPDTRYSAPPIGKFGIVSNTDRFLDWHLNNNVITNIANPIYVIAEQGKTYDNSDNYLITDNIDITENQIESQFIGNKITNQYIDNAITFRTLDRRVENEWHPGSRINCSKNGIEKVWRGIFFTGWNNKDIQITYNSISLTPDLNTKREQYGISMVGGAPQSGLGDVIQENSIEGNCSEGNVYDNQTGILVADNDEHIVSCNYLNSTTYGIRFKNVALGKCVLNHFVVDNKYGLVLDGPSAIIGQQGNDNYPADNSWQNMLTNGAWTACLNNANALHSPMYVRGGAGGLDPSGNGIYFPFSNINLNYYDNIGVGGNGSLLASANPLTEYDPGSCDFSFLFSRAANGASGGKLLRRAGNSNTQSRAALSDSMENIIAAAELIATGGISIPTLDSAERINVMQQQLFNTLMYDTLLLNNSVILQNFIQSNSSNGFWYMKAISEALGKNYVQAAEIMLQQWQPITNADINYKRYYGWLAAKADTAVGLQTQDTLDMYTLAQGCPAYDGTSVYMARNLYNYLLKDNIMFTDSCVVNTAASRFVNNTKVISTEIVKVYPNPSMGIVNIQLPNKGNWEIIATDNLGRIVWQDRCNGCEGAIKHNFENNKGLYFIKITNTNTGKQSVNKIILQ